VVSGLLFSIQINKYGEKMTDNIQTQTPELVNTPTTLTQTVQAITQAAQIVPQAIPVITPLERKAMLLGELARYTSNKLEKADVLKRLGDVRYQQSQETGTNFRLRGLAKNCYLAARNLELTYRVA
jgi:hypothetical protein